MALGTGYERQACYVARALEVVGERWTLLILRDCFYGVRHFGDLLDHLDISRGVLTDRLNTLVDTGVLERTCAGRCTEYRLTEAGRELWPILYGLGVWGEKHLPAGHRARRFSHVSCGADIDDVGRCPACGEIPDVADLMVRPGSESGISARNDQVTQVLASPHRMLTPIP